MRLYGSMLSFKCAVKSYGSYSECSQIVYPKTLLRRSGGMSLEIVIKFKGLRLHHNQVPRPPKYYCGGPQPPFAPNPLFEPPFAAFLLLTELSHLRPIASCNDEIFSDRSYSQFYF